MNKRFSPDAECVAAAKDASGDRLTDEEIDAAFQTIYEFRRSLEEAGDIASMGDKLRAHAERQAAQAKFMAAVRKRHAALNVLVRDRQEMAVDSLMKAGMTPREALLTVMEGSQKGVEGARNSVYALNLAYEARYAGGMMADLQRGRPQVLGMLSDPAFDADVVREMWQRREGGKPGVTGNADAKFVAEVFAAHAERARLDLNAMGATIGKLDGWFGVQAHDDIKMLREGRDAWITTMVRRLDLPRTFPDGNFMDALGKLYDEFVTGFRSRELDTIMPGQRVNPANLAKMLGEHRVLHFKSPDDALAYRDQFGHGNTFSGMVAYLRHSARNAALMDALGPNPENMFGSLVKSIRAKVAADPAIPDAKRAAWVKELDAEAGVLKQAIDIATGTASRPVNVTAAQISQDLRAIQSMAKLGSSVLSSITDVPTAAVAAHFRGTNLFRGLTHQLGAIFRGRPKDEAAEISYLLGEGFDGIIGHIVAPAAAQDGPSGKLAKLTETFFRVNGQTWWTDVQRAAAGRMIAAEMGMRAGTKFDALPAKYRHVLSLHGIDEGRWELIGKAVRLVDGKAYVTPDMIRALPDEAFEGRTDLDLGDNAGSRAMKIADSRRRLELDLLAFVADETNYGVVEVDARGRRFMTRGNRPGTAVGEGLRFIGQFKQFPVTFTQRVLGRALYGHRADAGLIEKSAHIGALLAGMTIAGYMAMTLKDMAKGHWPPRDPGKAETWTAAFLQGGAAGLYGDFLFAQQNRYGSSIAESLAGPTAGAITGAFETVQAAAFAGIGRLQGEDARMPAAEALSLAVQNTPFGSLFYTRAAVDALFLNSMREAISPGYLRRQETRRREDYGQGRWLPQTVLQ